MLACTARRAIAARLRSGGVAACDAALRCVSTHGAPDSGAAGLPASPAPLERAPDGVSAALYDGHIRLSAPQRVAVALGSAVGALVSPARADLVAAFGETTGHAALARMRSRMAADAEGAAILADRPRITDATLDACWSMPPGSFGAAYAAFMGTRAFAPHERPPVRFVNDAELAYVATRAREVHDLWHVLFGCDTTVMGELALKAVEALQTGLPSAGLAALVAPLRLSRQRRAAFAAVYLPWALRAGAKAADLMCIRYERHFTEPLQDVRLRWRIEPAPARAEALALSRAGAA